MRSRAFAGWGVAALLIATIGMTGRVQSAESGYPGTLKMLAGPPGGQWNALGDKMAELLREAGIPAENQVGGGVENLYLVGEGQADIGFTLYSFLGAAAAGEKELPKVNLDNAVLLANLYPQVLYVIVRKEIVDEYNVKTLADMLEVKGRIRFATLPKGTGSEFIFDMLLRNAYQTDYGLQSALGWHINFWSYAEITKRFLAGELDVCAYTAGPGTYLIPALEKANLDAVLLPMQEAKLDLMTHQFMTITYTIQAGDYESVTEDVLTLGDYSCLVTQAKLTAGRPGLPHQRSAVGGQGRVGGGVRRYEFHVAPHRGGGAQHRAPGVGKVLEFAGDAGAAQAAGEEVEGRICHRRRRAV